MCFLTKRGPPGAYRSLFIASFKAMSWTGRANSFHRTMKSTPMDWPREDMNIPDIIGARKRQMRSRRYSTVGITVDFQF